MGNTYSNLTLVAPGVRPVKAALEALGRQALVLCADDRRCVVFDREAELQNAALHDLGAALSEVLECVSFAFSVDDESFAASFLHRDGELLNLWVSDPGAAYDWGVDASNARPDALLLCRALHRDASEPAVAAALSGTFVGHTDRHAALVAALGLPSFAVGLGYRYAVEELLSGREPRGVLVSSEEPIEPALGWVQ